MNNWRHYTENYGVRMTIISMAESWSLGFPKKLFLAFRYGAALYELELDVPQQPVKVLSGHGWHRLPG